jgi:hypothetical protein
MWFSERQLKTQNLELKTPDVKAGRLQILAFQALEE